MKKWLKSSELLVRKRFPSPPSRSLWEMRQRAACHDSVLQIRMTFWSGPELLTVLALPYIPQCHFSQKGSGTWSLPCHSIPVARALKRNALQSLCIPGMWRCRKDLTLFSPAILIKTLETERDRNCPDSWSRLCTGSSEQEVPGVSDMAALGV